MWSWVSRVWSLGSGPRVYELLRAASWDSGSSVDIVNWLGC